MAEFAQADSPEVTPRACIFCDSFEPRGGWINTFTSNDLGRIMLICVPCALQIAKAAGAMAPREVAKLRAQVADAEAEKAIAEQTVERIREQISSFA